MYDNEDVRMNYSDRHYGTGFNECGSKQNRQCCLILVSHKDGLLCRQNDIVHVFRTFDSAFHNVTVHQYHTIISDGSRNVSIEYAADDGNLWEESGNITIWCNANCNPPCDRYQIYHNDTLKDTSKEIKITKTLENSGRYYCSASNSGGQGYTQSRNIANITIKCK